MAIRSMAAIVERNTLSARARGILLGENAAKFDDLDVVLDEWWNGDLAAEDVCFILAAMIEWEPPNDGV